MGTGGRRRRRGVALVGGVALALAHVVAADAQTPPTRSTTTTVDCPATAVIETAVTCNISVTDTDTGTASTPTGGVTVTASGETTGCPLSGGACSVTVHPTGNTVSLTVSAAYAETGEHATSVGTDVIAVNTRTSATAVACTPSAVSFGNAATCTATVTDSSGATPTVATSGTVTFTHPGAGSGTFSPASCALASGSCSVTYTPTAATAAHQVKAQFAATATFGASSETTTVSATGRSVDAGMDCQPAAATIDAPVTCTVTVSDDDSGTAATPTGDVAFSSSAFGTFIAPTCTLSGGSCSQTFTPTVASVSPVPLAVAYAGDALHASGTAQAALTSIAKRGPTLALSCTATVPAGDPATCTATVSDSATITPTGNVGFSTSGDGTFSPPSCTLADGTCVTTFIPTTVGAGTRTIHASYNGSDTHLSSTDDTTLDVTPRAASTSVACVPATVKVGDPAICTATVADVDGAVVPTGSVAFTHTGDGTQSAPSCTLSGGSCSVSFTPASTASPARTVTGSYDGSGAHSASAAGGAVTVVGRPVAVAVTCTPASLTLGAAVRCAATAADAAGTSNRPAGAVAFSSAGQTTSCTLADGACSATFTPDSAGTHAVAVTYGGSAFHGTGTASTTVTVRPKPAPVRGAPPKVKGQGTCVSHRVFTTRLFLPRKLRSLSVTLGGRAVAHQAARVAQQRITIDLRGRPKGTYKLVVKVVTRSGKKRTFTRTYRTCAGRAG